MCLCVCVGMITDLWRYENQRRLIHSYFFLFDFSFCKITRIARYCFNRNGHSLLIFRPLQKSLQIKNLRPSVKPFCIIIIIWMNVKTRKTEIEEISLKIKCETIFIIPKTHSYTHTWFIHQKMFMLILGESQSILASDQCYRVVPFRFSCCRLRRSTGVWA